MGKQPIKIKRARFNIEPWFMDAGRLYYNCTIEVNGLRFQFCEPMPDNDFASVFSDIFNRAEAALTKSVSDHFRAVAKEKADAQTTV